MTFALNVVYLGLCPCGQTIYALTDKCGVAHTEPMCDKFRELEPNEFLKYVRQSRGIGEA